MIRQPLDAFRARFLRRRLLFGIVVAIAPVMSCDQFNPFAPPGAFQILATPTGCGVKVDNNKTISWVVTFTASGVAPGAQVQWAFSDGTTGTGQVVIKSFDTASRETAAAGDPFTNTEEHDPVKFDVTATVGNDVVTQTYELPMRGTLDGGAEPGGDTCVPDEGRTHVATGTTICYLSNPPASGPHTSAAGVSPVAAGFYDEALATERWVHNLEHGAIVLLYDCGGPCSDELKAQLQALFDSLPESARFNEKKMVITRYAGISGACTGTDTFPDTGPFLAIAWDVQKSFDSLDTAGIVDFYTRHVDHGPEDAPIPQ